MVKENKKVLVELHPHHFIKKKRTELCQLISGGSVLF